MAIQAIAAIVRQESCILFAISTRPRVLATLIIFQDARAFLRLGWQISMSTEHMATCIR